MRIYKELVNYISEEVKALGVSKDVYCNSWYLTAHHNRHIQVFTEMNNNGVHYEYSLERNTHKPYLELHFEGTFAQKHKAQIKKLCEETRSNNRLKWGSWWHLPYGKCRLIKELKNKEDIVSGIKELREIFEPKLADMCKEIQYTPMPENEYKYSCLGSELNNQQVSLLSKNIEEIFGCKLVIPPYQRIYCWEKENIQTLWNEITTIDDKEEYHLGSIILHKVGDEYHIIDGQQRMVTVSLILLALRYGGQMPLIYQKFTSQEAQEYVANAKFVIDGIIKRSYPDGMIKKVTQSIKLSVLVLNGGSLDLAYTFFSNQNSKGVPLSDLDLLKAHHLRYLTTESQSEHLAKKWNVLTLEKGELLDHTLRYFLYRLRKWNRKQYCEEYKPHYIKEEYSADIIMSDIPAFGESFKFNEKIQGGAHFFAFAEIYAYRLEEFRSLVVVKAIRENLRWESHWKYADVIENLLFAYFIKFGKLYIEEALYCIASYIAQHRYSTNRAMHYKILEYATESEIVMMIDQASSPTFFFAEVLSLIKITSLDIEQVGGIQRRFADSLSGVYELIKNNITECRIKKMIDNE